MSNEPVPPPAPHSSPSVDPATPPPPGGKSDRKLLAGLFGIFLGAFGIHKFYLGYQKEGIILLLVTVVTCGFGGAISSVIGLIEGILYLTKTDAEFEATYVTGRKPWF